ncbi:Gibberellin 2-beta-dioxygenase [Apostasia shenzhenica]|uniref:gibberellin 2beta-dioxygenase n=1 Tax=Apostasia shenzhenica TaxID=1088818 RepID=A0A2I0A7W7_9ASPA|nr:Gibberellin 2-beta-dioxygenase [Apostasia shenzhenica]
MVVLAKPTSVERFPVPKLRRSSAAVRFPGAVPVIDLSSTCAADQLVRACEELGFFKLTNHGVSNELTARLEAEAVRFFSLNNSKKDAVSLGYGRREIGPSGDVGWIEYLLLQVNMRSLPLSSSFRSVLEEYISAMKKLAREVLELIAEGLRIQPRDILSKLLMEEESDLILRLNHYPPCPITQNLTGFGEHTDPQIISILRSNNTSGLQILARDGRWVPVPPDQSSFFINVGDSLQVMTNGRFRSVKHRVLANTTKSRFSMIFFGGPPLKQRIAPLPRLMEEGEQSIYREFTWREYKNTAYKTKLADDRLVLFEKN